MKNQMKKEILVLISVLLVVAVVICGLWLGFWAVDSHHQKAAFESLSAEFALAEPTPCLTISEESPPPDESTQPEETATPSDAPPRHDLDALTEANPDCVGWLTVPGTGIDYPIMHTPDAPERYLRRDFYGDPASGGTPFLDGRSAAKTEGQNLIVYGHNMLDGSMFKPLISYLDAGFLEEHRDIYLEMGGSQYRYEALAALETTTRSPLYSYTDLSGPAVEIEFRSALLQAAGLEAVHQAGGYLTLSTCGNGGGEGRVLVVAGLQGEVGA